MVFDQLKRGKQIARGSKMRAGSKIGTCLRCQDRMKTEEKEAGKGAVCWAVLKRIG